MPIEMLKAKDGFYFPYDGAWDTPEDDEIYKEAVRVFEEMKEFFEYVALIKSHDVFTHGYWIETEEKDVRYPDNLLKSHKQTK